tara:strand:- start:4204 stop:7272 length:3069 start_codon:yes stop_codon:yes gene_type:complete
MIDNTSLSIAENFLLENKEKQKSFVTIQRIFRVRINFRFRFSLLIMFFNLTYHIYLTQSNYTNVYKLFDEYSKNFIFNDKIILTKKKYEMFVERILTLRSFYGGYYDTIYFDYSSINLFDIEKYWKIFLKTTFHSKKISSTPCNSDKPIFSIDKKNNDSLNTSIQYEWKNEQISGCFKEDPFGIIPCFPIFNIDFVSFKDKNLESWYRFNSCPFYLDYTFNSNLDNIVTKYKNEEDEFKKLSENAVSDLTKEFISSNIQTKYSLIYFFGIGDEKHQFVSMLLYMILCKDTPEQGSIILNKLPMNVRNILEKRCEITEDKLSCYTSENDEKTYEMKICLLKTNDIVKRKAIEKLKEIQNKMSDISKPQQYLDKLLTIPFGVYKQESIFEILKIFLERIQEYGIELHLHDIPSSWYELHDFFSVVNEISILHNTSKENIIPLIRACKKCLNLKTLQYRDEKGEKQTVRFNKRNIKDVTENLQDYVKYADNDIQKCISTVIRNLLPKSNIYCNLVRDWPRIVSYLAETQNTIHQMLEASLYGQETAKQAIENIICEWITGDNQGYCFGFEGPPGVGKTTLAKSGLSKCLIDSNGESRPFIFIALGGMSHGSTLEGYGYTYASATCGQIVNSIIRAKCMNPIIFFDELDKVSRTEHGQEIIGILMHLTDPVQNSEFYDKYFEGVALDLSKALLIFSYNDITRVDPILRERIHSIRFNSFSTQDKIQICKDYLIPSIIKRIGMPEHVVDIKEEVLTFIIDKYTHESGVRKIKQILIQIYREINKRLLGNQISIPVVLECETIGKEYLKALPLKHTKKVSNTPHVGLVNGLFAMNCGGGGIIQISAKTFQNLGSSTESFQLTGQLGDVMKESVKVAKTAVSNILNEKTYDSHSSIVNLKKLEYHIHCSENGVPKDGPSAGLALFIVMLSSIINVPVKNDVAFTGEIDLTGNVGIIGGLSDKLRGAYVAGVKTVFCPIENESDVEKIDREKEHWITEIEIKYVHSVLDKDLLNAIFIEPVDKFIKKIYN